MRRRVIRLLASALAAPTLCVLSACASSGGKIPAIEAFFFSLMGTAAEQVKSYRIAETARGRIVRIELYYAHVNRAAGNGR